MCVYECVSVPTCMCVLAKGVVQLQAFINCTKLKEALFEYKI